MRYAMAMMNGARLAVGAQAVGIAEAAYREADRYASQRIQFKQPVARAAGGDAHAGSRCAARSKPAGRCCARPGCGWTG